MFTPDRWKSCRLKEINAGTGSISFGAFLLARLNARDYILGGMTRDTLTHMSQMAPV